MVVPMRSLHTSIDIHAAPETVWAVLTDFSAYGTWNPFVHRIEGPLTVGGRLLVELRPDDGRPFTVRPTVLVAEPGREFRWLGRLAVPGLFSGEHAFRLLRRSDGGVRFVHEETFRGCLVGLFWPKLNGATRRGFEAMNRALKARAEALDSHVPDQRAA